MIRLRGKQAGQTLTLRQWANDWISADRPDGSQAIVRPTAVRLEGAELEKMLADQATAGPGHHAGQFWTIWKLHPDGRFTRRGPS